MLPSQEPVKCHKAVQTLYSIGSLIINVPYIYYSDGYASVSDTLAPCRYN